MNLDSEQAILREAAAIAAHEVGGTLATMHAEDGTPYLTYVFFHLREDGGLVFGSMAGPQHARNIAATPEVSFLVDNREVVEDDWQRFERVVIEGRAEPVPRDDPRYPGLMETLTSKHEAAARFTEQNGELYLISPRRIILRKGLDPKAHVVEFDGPRATAADGA